MPHPPFAPLLLTANRRRQAVALSPAEDQLARRLGEDVTLSELAQRLGKRPETLRSQLKALYRKLRVNSRHAAVDLLHRIGWFTQTGD
ncbi:MAG: helix-turn-helix transcriptional regulator [Verrucomicrobiae bacterium]|nr:helix-turn-helix transcriptional regulator [Verrucomicrobiae bacterium]